MRSVVEFYIRFPEVKEKKCLSLYVYFTGGCTYILQIWYTLVKGPQKNIYEEQKITERSRTNDEKIRGVLGHS